MTKSDHDVTLHCTHDHDADATESRRTVVLELRDGRIDRGSLAKAFLAFTFDAVIFVCVTHLAACGILPGMIAGGLIGSLVGVRIYAARSRALGMGVGAFGASTFGALVLGVVGLFSLRTLRS